MTQDRVQFLKEERAIAEEKMKLSIAMKPIVVYIQTRLLEEQGKR